MHTQTDLLADGWIYGWIEGWMYLATWPIFSWGKERFSIWEWDVCLKFEGKWIMWTWGPYVGTQHRWMPLFYWWLIIIHTHNNVMWDRQYSMSVMNLNNAMKVDGFLNDYLFLVWLAPFSYNMFFCLFHELHRKMETGEMKPERVVCAIFFTDGVEEMMMNANCFIIFFINKLITFSYRSN